MRFRKAFVGLLLVCCMGPLAAQEQECSDGPASQQLGEGIGAYGAGEYAKAAELFQSATQLDPNCPMAWLYLGNSYLKQYKPGSDSAENRQLAEKAREQFETVLGQQSENEEAMAAIAFIYFQQKKWDDAQTWYEKLTGLNRDNKEAFYWLGVIAFNRSAPELQHARAKLSMKPEDAGPIQDPEMRQALRAKYLPVIQEGIDDLKRAVEIEAEYDDAMAYLNLLYRMRADLEESAAEYQADITQANDWRRQRDEIRKDPQRRR